MSAFNPDLIAGWRVENSRSDEIFETPEAAAAFELADVDPEKWPETLRLIPHTPDGVPMTWPDMRWSIVGEGSE